MLRGGYHRGSNVLISGAPGTAKSTLSGLFAAAAGMTIETKSSVPTSAEILDYARKVAAASVEILPNSQQVTMRTVGSSIFRNGVAA